MTSAARDLSALLGSRICHDLISPLGAICNGIELLSMSGVAASPELSLISESVESANARIRFFRIAFGAVSPGQSLGREEIRSILSALTRAGRLRIDWQAAEACPRAEAKLAFLLLQCCESAMPWGGEITVTQRAGGWRIDAAAERLRLDDRLWAHLSDPDPEAELSAAEVHFPLAHAVAAALHRPLAVETGETGLSISF